VRRRPGRHDRAPTGIVLIFSARPTTVVHGLALAEIGEPTGPSLKTSTITESCGRSSVVERQLPKLYVVGSIPIARSNPSRADVASRNGRRPLAPALTAIAAPRLRTTFNLRIGTMHSSRHAYCCLDAIRMRFGVLRSPTDVFRE
jgi:hypothetical protein